MEHDINGVMHSKLIGVYVGVLLDKKKQTSVSSVTVLSLTQPRQPLPYVNFVAPYTCSFPRLHKEVFFN